MVRRKSVEEGKQVIEPGTRILNPTNVSYGQNIYIGHDCFIDGYHEGPGLKIGDNCWIGPGCYIHAAGGIKIGKNTGIGPHVKMLTSYHDMRKTGKPVIENDLRFETIEIGEDCDIGTGTILMPGAKIGKGCIVDAGMTVRGDFSEYENKIIKRDGAILERREMR